MLFALVEDDFSSSWQVHPSVINVGNDSDGNFFFRARNIAINIEHESQSRDVLTGVSPFQLGFISQTVFCLAFRTVFSFCSLIRQLLTSKQSLGLWCCCLSFGFSPSFLWFARLDMMEIMRERNDDGNCIVKCFLLPSPSDIAEQIWMRHSVIIKEVDDSCDF